VQPKGIYYIFQTELWERFSYYGLTAILILYLSEVFNLPDVEVYTLYGTYTALVYTTPILGGLLADQILGPFHTVILGGLLISVGHFVMVLVDQNHFYFFFGLSLIIVGTGFFKPNISTLLGQLYSSNDARRENGFTWAYLGCNIGTIIAPILTSIVALKFNWNFAFGLAGVGMIIALIILYRGKKYLNQKSLSAPQYISKKMIFMVSLGIILLLAIMNSALFYSNLIFVLLTVITAIALGLIGYAWRNSDPYERSHILFVSVLIVFYVIFMMMLQQSGGMLNLFTARNVDRYIFEWHIPAGMFQSVEPFFVVILGPFYTRWWTHLNQKKINFDYPLKFIIALIGMTIAFAFLILSIRFFNHDGFISLWWINFSYFLQASSELFIGPIGLAMVSSLIPKRFIGIFMGLWILALAFANFIAAKVGAWMSPITKQEALHIPTESIHLYGAIIEKLTFFAFSATVILLLVRPFLLSLLARNVQSATLNEKSNSLTV